MTLDAAPAVATVPPPLGAPPVAVVRRKLTLDEQLEALEEEQRLKRELKLAFFKPYPKQQAFIELTRTKREAALIAANQFGKSDTGAYLGAVFMTGLYPKDWKGRRWHRPTRGWIAGETSLVVRDVQQKKLCGEPGVTAAFGTGMIPKELFADKPSLARGITDAYDTIQVKFVEADGNWHGGISVARFKSYEQGRTKFQGETLDWGHEDEEPDDEVHAEFLTRIQEGGVLFSTFTPLRGRSKVVLRYMEESNEDRGYVNATLDDAEHFSEEERRRRFEGYASHERDARARGIPLLGSGAVYQFSDVLIREAYIEQVPPAWAKLWGIDFGIDHPFAAVLMAWDREVDCIHILHALRLRDVGALDHATAMRNIAAAVPVAWPHDGHTRDKGSGEALKTIYRANGLSMLHQHSTYEDGGYSREPAVLEITERARTGRFKVAAHLSDWLQEFRMFHRKDGKIVAIEDDIMSATEKVVMMKRFARPVPLGGKVGRRRHQTVAQGVEDSYFGMEA